MAESPEIDNGVYVIDSDDYVNYHPLDDAKVLEGLEGDEHLRRRVLTTAHEIANRSEEQSAELVAEVTEIQTQRWRRIQKRLAESERQQTPKHSRLHSL